MIAKARTYIGQGTLYLIFALLSFVVILPFLWLVSTSLKTEADWTRYPVIIFPRAPQWGNYREALIERPFLKHTWNTVLLAVPSTCIAVLSSALTGYGFARLEGPGKRTLFTLVLAMMMVPGMVTLIPSFALFARLRLVNTYWPWYLWALAGSSFHIFMFRQFFAQIPRDLEDAAEVDGCGHLRIFWQIFLPISAPVIATSALFYFEGLWGDWATPNVFLNADKTTLGVLIANGYKDPKGNVLETITTAAIMVYLLPTLLVYLFAQRHLVQGIATTGIKG